MYITVKMFCSSSLKIFSVYINVDNQGKKLKNYTFFFTLQVLLVLSRLKIVIAARGIQTYINSLFI